MMMTGMDKLLPHHPVHRVLSLVWCVASISCGQITHGASARTRTSQSEEHPPFTIRAAADTVRWQDLRGYRMFVVPVRFWNHAAKPLYRHWCAASIQKRIDDAWIEVQQPICVEAYPAFPAIAPGDSAEQIIHVYRYPDPRHPYSDPRLGAGVYRIVFFVGYKYGVKNGLTVDLSEEARATQAIVVVAP